MFSKESATYIPRTYLFLVLAAVLVVIGTTATLARSYFFSTGNPVGRIATASRPGSFRQIESADVFILTQETIIRQATFTGLVPAGSELSDVTEVVVEIYRVFPDDSVNPPSDRVLRPAGEARDRGLLLALGAETDCRPRHPVHARPAELDSQ